MNQLSLPTLLDVPAGRKLRVERLTGSREICSRLYSLGILPGTEMEVRSAAKGQSGCVRVRVRQGSLVLGESMAEAVCCSEQYAARDAGLCAPGAPCRFFHSSDDN